MIDFNIHLHFFRIESRTDGKGPFTSDSPRYSREYINESSFSQKIGPFWNIDRDEVCALTWKGFIRHVDLPLLLAIGDLYVVKIIKLKHEPKRMKYDDNQIAFSPEDAEVVAEMEINQLV